MKAQEKPLSQYLQDEGTSCKLYVTEQRADSYKQNTIDEGQEFVFLVNFKYMCVFISIKIFYTNWCTSHFLPLNFIYVAINVIYVIFLSTGE